MIQLSRKKQKEKEKSNNLRLHTGKAADKVSEDVKSPVA